MAPDKGSHARQPALAPSLAKGMNRTPLTPKIATPAAAPRVAHAGVTTPLPRRTQQQQQQQGGYQAPASASNRDDYVSPISSFLNSNVTPRSGSRQSRHDSNHSTPTGTPNPDKDKDAWESRSGLGISGADGEPLRRTVTFSPLSDNGGHGRDAPAPADSKFFYASDAKGSQQPKAAPPQPRAAANFFYASGHAVEKKSNPPPAPNVSFTPALGHTPEPQSSKFIYANGIPDLQPSLKQSALPRPSSVSSTTSRVTTGRLNPATAPAAGQPHTQRPTSPVKMPSHQSLSSLRSTAQPLPNAARSPTVLSHTATSPTVAANRRVSTGSVTSRRSHSRHSSVSNITVDHSPPTSKVLPASVASSEASTPCSTTSHTMTLAPPFQPTEQPPAAPCLDPMAISVPLPGLEAKQPEAAIFSELHSPTKAAHTSDQLNELISNARRERKVQDLEITNASLTAINRSLERRLRKQTAELRRYKRLSRAGRFSLASTTASSVGMPEDSLLSGRESSMDGLGLSDLSEEDILGQEEETDDEDEESSEFSETDSASDGLGPEERAARDAKHRQKDERRLELDLSKHRELLVDSQKINQSLRRCLGWTEELINEGKKALEYKVSVSDVKLGGRVLIAEDDEDDLGGDGMSYGDDEEEKIHGLPESLLWEKEPQDRDSGVELPGEGG